MIFRSVRGISIVLGLILFSGRVFSADLSNLIKSFPKESYFELKSGAEAIGRSSLFRSEKNGLHRFVEHSEMKVTLFGKPQLIETDLDTTVDLNLKFQEFSYKMKSPDSMIEIKGRRVGSNIRIEKLQAGKPQFRDIPIQEPMILSPLIRLYALSFPGLKEKTEARGDAYLLEPSALVLIPMTLTISKTKENSQTYQLIAKYLNQSLISQIRGDGSLIEENTDIAGMPVVAKPTSKKNYEITSLVATKLDLVHQARVPFSPLPQAKEMQSFKVKISGIPTQEFQLTRHRQKFTSNILTVSREKMPVKSGPAQGLVGRADLKKYLDAEVSIPVYDPQIQRTAREIVKTESDLWKRALLIHQFVFRTLEKRAFVSLPDAIEALQTKKGDCNEHSVLYTALARAAGVPTRTVVGLVYSDTYQASAQPGFYYHAWVEVYTGSEWVAIDPTWNQIPADVTHLAFVEGGADQQIQIASLMGKVKLEPTKGTNVN